MELIAGEKHFRLQIYLARRYFQMSRDEYQALPWWEWEILLEGLRDSGILKSNDENDPAPAEPRPVPNQPGKPKPINLASADLGSFAASGYQVRRAG